MTHSKLAIIRADASTDIGIGHIIRMVALAEALIERHWQVVFYYQNCPDNLLEKIEATGAKIEKLPENEGNLIKEADYLSKQADRTNASLVVLDGYLFDDEYQEAVSKCRALTMTMDDYQHCQRYHTDIILNQNPGTEDWQYNCVRNATRLLLGTDYILLRSQFQAVSQPTRGPEFKIVITLGGADADNVSGKLLDAASKAALTLTKSTDKSYKLILVCGGANPHVTVLKSQIEQLQKTSGDTCQYELLTNVDNMAELLGSAHLVISAGGGTVWEAAYLGTANMVVLLADNQKNIIKFADMGAVANLGNVNEIDYKTLPVKIIDLLQSDALIKMPSIARRLVDGKGAQRVTSVVESILSNEP